MKKNNNKGFTLIEVLVALFIFALVCASTAPAFINHAKYNHNSQEKTAAINIAEKVLNKLRTKDITNLPSRGYELKTYIIDGKTYIAKIYYCNTLKYCSKASRHLSVEISKDSKMLYSVETVYTQLK